MSKTAGEECEGSHKRMHPESPKALPTTPPSSFLATPLSFVPSAIQWEYRQPRVASNGPSQQLCSHYMEMFGKDGFYRQTEQKSYFWCFCKIFKACSMNMVSFPEQGRIFGNFANMYFLNMVLFHPYAVSMGVLHQDDYQLRCLLWVPSASEFLQVWPSTGIPSGSRLGAFTALGKNAPYISLRKSRWFCCFCLVMVQIL